MILSHNFRPARSTDAFLSFIVIVRYITSGIHISVCTNTNECHDGSTYQGQTFFYQEANGEVPVGQWLTDLAKYDRKAFAKCAAKIKRLEDKGHELRRPDADYLEDGIYELRAKKGHIAYRILYCFHGQNAVLLCHTLTKERAIPPADLARAKARKAAFEKEPATHTASYCLKGN